MIVLLLTAAFAADDSLYATPLSMGGTSVTAISDNSAILVNPGAMGLKKRYDIQAFGTLGPYLGTHWGLSIVDASSSDVFTLGIAYQGDRADPPLRTNELPGWGVPGEEIGNVRQYHDGAVALALHTTNRRYGFGFSGNGGYYKHERLGSGWSADAEVGVGARPIDELKLGLAVNNLLEDKLGAPRAFMGGVGTFIGPLEVAGEVTFSPGVTEEYGVDSAVFGGGGLDLRASEAVSVRAGYRLDRFQEQWATFGVAIWGGPNALEYSGQIRTDGKVSFVESVHTLSFRVTMPSELREPMSPGARDL